MLSVGRVVKGIREGERREQRGRKKTIQHLSHNMVNIQKLKQEAGKSPMSHTSSKTVSWLLSPTSEWLWQSWKGEKHSLLPPLTAEHLTVGHKFLLSRVNFSFGLMSYLRIGRNGMASRYVSRYNSGSRTWTVQNFISNQIKVRLLL